MNVLLLNNLNINSNHKILQVNKNLNKDFLKIIKQKNRILGKKESENIELDLKSFVNNLENIINAFKINKKFSTIKYYTSKRVSKSHLHEYKNYDRKWFVEKYFNKSTNPERYY